MRNDPRSFGPHPQVYVGSGDGRVHAPVGGIEDLKQHRVRFIGDPATRIAEDYLRILRFFRFHAAYGQGAPDPDGLHAAILAREGLHKLSRERVRVELLKLLLAPRAAPTLVVMVDAGLLDRVLGGVPYLAAAANVIAIEAVLGLEPDPLRRLAGLAVSVAEDAERLWEKLRLANVEQVRFVEKSLAKLSGARHTARFDVRLVYEKKIDVAAECERLKKEIEKIEKGLTTGQRQLGNEQFLAKAPAQVVENLRKQQQELAVLHQKTQSELNELGCS